MQTLDESWKNWVDTNLKNNCDKMMMYKDMIKAGFGHDLITSELDLNDTELTAIQQELKNQHFVAGKSHLNKKRKAIFTFRAVSLFIIRMPI